MTTTMKAIVQENYGSADVLELRDIDRPTAGTREVLLRVHSAGISRGDVHLKGEPYLVRAAVGVRRPKRRVPGQDVAGTVVATGPDITRFVVGDEVFGIARGSFAQYAVAPEDKLAHKPPILTFTQNSATWSPGMGRQLHAMLLDPFVSQRLTTVMNKEHFSGLERLAAHVVNGTLTSFLDRPFDLSSTPDAVRHLLAGKASGKVVITV